MSGETCSGAAMEPGAVISVETRHSSGFHHKRPIVLAGGQGAEVWDAEGRRYIDCDTGHGLAILGHGHPAVTAAVKAQAEKLLTCGESFYSEPRARLYAELATVMPPELNRLFLCNSGTEAMEAAIKLARYYELGEKDVVFTIFTDSAELYQSRLQEMRDERKAYTESQAQVDLERRLFGLGIDNLKELGYYDRKALHNLKYFTWVEQQQRAVEDLRRLWEPGFWADTYAQVQQWDREIDSFNQRVAAA